MKRQFHFDFQGCESTEIVGDGYCDDNSNTLECNYDGGDCCGSDVNKYYCSECKCYSHKTCNAPSDLLGNRFCNDETNIGNCNFDNGDCCGACVNTDHCSDCVCHDEAQPILDLSCEHNFMPF